MKIIFPPKVGKNQIVAEFNSVFGLELVIFTDDEGLDAMLPTAEGIVLPGE